MWHNGKEFLLQTSYNGTNEIYENELQNNDKDGLQLRMCGLHNGLSHDASPHLPFTNVIYFSSWYKNKTVLPQNLTLGYYCANKMIWDQILTPLGEGPLCSQPTIPHKLFLYTTLSHPGRDVGQISFERSSSSDALEGLCKSMKQTAPSTSKHKNASIL